ncbi:HEAT repeat domain-containing protein [Chloroflexia bacterium SDU3-3]|nr:HEAT repeat domain-containing protein [Chloroflexia bacterium SDU3-3]
MIKVYLIAKPSVTSDVVFQVADEYYWIWLDESEETEQTPYTLSLRANSSETKIFYLEEHKDIFEAKYFIVHGNDPDRALEQIRKAIDLYSDTDLLERCAQAGDTRERGSAIYQLGIALTARAFDTIFVPAFERAMVAPEPAVRIAAIWAIAYPHWPELRGLVELAAAQDADDEVRRVAGRLLEVYDEP